MGLLNRLKKAATVATANSADATSQTTRQRGVAAEQCALDFLQSKGLVLLERNYRAPWRGGGEIDLIMRCCDGTVVFVEVRQRAQHAFGGAAASIDQRKQQRIMRTASYYLTQRFDVMPD